ncbi:MAG: hypothetical protein PHX18_04195 [Candidatus Gastranaerophilales bacterium]|nr:hypothetical protein [Candidatus Gastranaerophilales bacterium]
MIKRFLLTAIIFLAAGVVLADEQPYTIKNYGTGYAKFYSNGLSIYYSDALEQRRKEIFDDYYAANTHYVRTEYDEHGNKIEYFSVTGDFSNLNAKYMSTREYQDLVRWQEEQRAKRQSIPPEVISNFKPNYR